MFDKETVKPGIVLGATALILAFLLAVVNIATRDVIAQRKIADTESALSSVIEGAAFGKIENSDTDNEIYTAKKDGETVGYCVKVSAYGYSSTPVTMIVGVDTDGKVLGVKITESDETPGLGSKAADSSFLQQFTGKTGELKVDKDGGDIAAVSGATKTSRAVANGVNKAIETVKNLKGGAADE